MKLNAFIIKMSKCLHECVKSYRLSTPIGVLDLTACPLGLHSLHINTKTEPEVSEHGIILISREQEAYKSIQDTINYFDWYFNYKDKTPAQQCNYPEICWSSICSIGSFTECVLKTLFSKVGTGESVSYKQLAGLSGKGSAYRAVGSVMGKNKIPLIIPCHRVIKTDGSLGNYSGGSGCDLKQWLLEHEKKLKIYYYSK